MRKRITRDNKRSVTVIIDEMTGTRTAIKDVDAAQPDRHGRVKVVRMYPSRRLRRRQMRQAGQFSGRKRAVKDYLASLEDADDE